MKKLKQYLFKSRAKKHLAHDLREKSFVNYDKAKSVILLFESDVRENNLFVKRIMEQLKGEGKKVIAWGFVDKKTVDSAILTDHRILNKKSCDLTGLPKESFLREIKDNKYDLLIDLSIHEILPLKYLLLYANVACKAGINKYEENLLDFKLNISSQTEQEQTEIVIKEDENNEMALETLIDEHFIFKNVIFYLKTIQTND